MTGRVEVALTYPVELNGVKVSVLHLRRPKVRDRLAAEKACKTDAEQEIFMIAALADVVPDQLHELDMADYAALQKAFSGFFTSAPNKSGN